MVCRNKSGEKTAPEPDRLLKFLSLESDSTLSRRIQEALQADGYCVLKSILNPDECARAISSIWTFVEDSSNAQVSRSDPSTWYPSSDHDPFPSMFQTNGAGWVNGNVRETLAERVFEPLFETTELHCSKEGFTFCRPTAPENIAPPTTRPQSPYDEPVEQDSESSRKQDTQVYHGDGFQTLQSLVTFEDQEEGCDGCFICWPKSHGESHQGLKQAINRSNLSATSLTDEEIVQLSSDFVLPAKRVYLNKGDMILWRSDLSYTVLSPPGSTPRFQAVAYTSMQPAAMTPKETYLKKMNAYKQRRTGDHRPHVESWHVCREQDNNEHRCSFRTSPPIVTKRLAELYGLLAYTKSNEEWLQERQSAMIRGVRFAFTEEGEAQHISTQPPLHACEARLEYISTELSMVGQDKYLGGMPSPCGDFIYGVPGSAKRVLRINVKTKVMDMVGPSFEGKFKWLRGVDVSADVMDNRTDFPRGCCLALPSNATSVLKINPETQDITTFGQDVLGSGEVGETGWFYHGGNVAANNGMVYAIPANATHVLKICPRTDRVWKIGPSFGAGRQKWFGGIIGTDGCIYGIPHNAVGVLKIDPIHDECTLLFQKGDEQQEEKRLASGQWKWHGGLAAGDKIYGFPNNANEVLVINVRTQQVYSVGNSTILQSGRHRVPQDGRYKYLGGALGLDEKSVYLFPCDAERVLKIDAETDELTLIGPLLLDGENKYQNGFVSEKDGCLYGIPQRALGILRIDPSAGDHVDVMPCSEDMIGTKDKFEGGVMGNDGCIYCIPLRAKTCVKVVPGNGREQKSSKTN